jgi:hypothetical protein
MLSSQSKNSITLALILVMTMWGGAVSVLAHKGVFLMFPMPGFALLVALGILIPTAVYFLSPALKEYSLEIGHRPILIFHVWRVPAALMFFWYGMKGELPPIFWVLSGVGDFLAGLLAFYTANKPLTTQSIRFFHRFGFADFVVAVVSGLVHTLALDPRMAKVAVLPMVLIPLFGVGISGTTHLIAFHMLRSKP